MSILERRLRKAWRKSRAIGWPKMTFAEFKRRWTEELRRRAS